MALDTVNLPRRQLASVKGGLQRVRRVVRLCRNDLRVNWLGQVFPVRPHTLSFLANDTCNSRCQMCCIWAHKRDRELTPDELALILNDPLFSNLKYVGVSGGEPTLRQDLPDIYRVLTQKQPPLRGTGIITNAIRKDDVISRIVDSSEICRAAGLPFNVMVSLDGVGEVHDLVRGREGNFQSAIEVIRYFRDKTDIPISIGCTITKHNLWHVGEVLDFCRNEGIYGRFRVAEFIQRLDNAEQVDSIRNFTDKEAYHLGLFFAKLEHTYERSPTIRRTYRNIRRMLMDGAERSINCPWQSTAATLDCRGQLLYCAPRSPVLGSCLEESARKLYLSNIKKRKAIIENDCSACIHDYHADKTISELWSDLVDRGWHWRLSLDRALRAAKMGLPSRPASGDSGAPRQILVTGWYGTETAGDKAILGEILHGIRSSYPNSRIMLSSLYPYVSRWTVRGLSCPDVEVIPVYDRAFWWHTEASDEVIMGGGPLMHLETLGIVLWAFLRAKRAGHRTRIVGCGIGPLHRGKRYEDAVRNILLLADVIELRSSAAVAWAIRMTGREDIVHSGDPAARFVQRWMEQNPGADKTPHLNLYLRDWTTEYQGDMTDRQFEETKARFEQQLGLWIHEICDELNLSPRLLPMHHFHIGNDDRDFGLRFARRYLSDLNPVIELAPLSLHEILASMQEAALCICMRYHSVVFAETLGLPFLAIDYTQGGKISEYLADRGRLNQMIRLTDVADGNWRQFLPREYGMAWAGEA